MSASLSVQRLIATALASIPGVSAVYDSPPPDAISPYLVIGNDLMTDWSTKTATGHEHRITVSVWDDGPSAACAKPVMTAVEAALNSLTGNSDGHRIASTLFLRALTLTDAEGWTQGIVDFRIRTTAI